MHYITHLIIELIRKNKINFDYPIIQPNNVKAHLLMTLINQNKYHKLMALNFDLWI